MKNLKKLVLIFTTNHVPELFSASESTVTYPGVEAGNSNSEHSIPHSSPQGEGRTGEGGGEWEFQLRALYSSPWGWRGKGEEWEFRHQAFLFLTLGLKGVGGRSVEIPIPSTLFLSLGFKGVAWEEWEFRLRVLYFSPWGEGGKERAFQLLALYSSS